MDNLPVIYGSCGGSDDPPEPYIPKESPNSLQSKAIFRVIDLIGEGVIGGLVNGAKSIYLDDVQLQADNGDYNFEGVEWAQRVGTPSQSVIPGNRAVETTLPVGVAVPFGSPVTRTITNPDLDAVRVHLSIPALFVQKDNGDLLGSSVQFTIEVVGHSSITRTVTGKCMSMYEVAYRVALPAGEAPWDIRVAKLTVDAPDSKSANTLNWATYTEILDHRFTYPDSALISGTVDSQLFGGRIPRRAYEILGLIIAVPTNYNPTTRVYTGLWDGTFKQAWSDNAVWGYYDMLITDRYGLGLTAPDKWALYPIAQYCDELVPDGFGGYDPRFTLNCHINTKHEAYAMINTLASVFRGMPIWSTGSVSCFQDSPAAAQLLASPANVKDGVFSYEGTDLKSRCTVAYVTWNDPDNGYKPTIEPVVNRAAVRKYGYREKEVAGMTTSQGQAHRVGRWLTDTPDAEKETVTYIAGQDHAFALPGMIIDVADPWRAGVRMGGRLKDGFESDVIGDNLINDISVWSLSGATAGRTAAGTTAPDGSPEYVVSDNSDQRYELPYSSSTPYSPGQILVADCFVKKDDVSNRTVALSIQGIGGTASNITVRFYTNTGSYSTVVGTGAALGFAAIYEEDGRWRVRIAGTLNSTNTSFDLRFYPAYGFTLTPTITATGSATIGGAFLRPVSGADYTLLNPTVNIRLDAPATLADGETYQVAVVMPDNTVEQRNVTTLAGERDVLAVSTAFSMPPAPNAMYVITGTDVAPRKFRLLAKTDTDDGKFTIIAAEHDPTKYARIEQNINLDQPTYYLPGVSGDVLPPNNVELLLKTYYADGNLRNMLLFTWEAASDPRVVSYQVEYRIDEDNWTSLPPVKGFLVEKYDLQAGTYYFRVKAVTATGATSIAVMDSIEVGADTMPDVTGLALVDGSSATEFTGGSARFTWDTVSLSDIPTAGGVDKWFKSYIVEIWKGGSLARTEYPTINQYEYTFEKNSADAGPDRSFTVKVYQLGNLGQISNTAAELTVSNPAPTMAGFTPVVTDIFKGLQISWASWSTSDPDVSMIKVYLDTSDPPTTLVEIASPVEIGTAINDLDVGTVYRVRLLPCDAFGDGVYSSVANGTPLILAGVDVDIELSQSIAMTDSDGNTPATLAALYDRVTAADGVSYVLAGTDKWIDYSFPIESYIDKIILHAADGNGQAYFATSPDGTIWSWFKAEADHTLTDSGNAVVASGQADAATNYLQLAAGLNVITMPQRVTARHCRLYLTGAYTTGIYELVFVREVIAEQVVADNLSAISANLGTIVAGYMQSDGFGASGGTMIDLDNGTMQLGGSGGGTTDPGFEFTPAGGLNLVGGIKNTDPDTLDYSHFTAGGLSSYLWNAGASEYQMYFSSKQIIPFAASNGVLTTIPGYWRDAPNVLPSVSDIALYDASYPAADQKLEISVDTPTETSEGSCVWQTTARVELKLSSYNFTNSWSNLSTSVSGSPALNTWYYSNVNTSTYTTPANTTSVTVSGNLKWDRGSFFPLYGAGSASVEVYFLLSGVKYVIYTKTLAVTLGSYSITLNVSLSKTVTFGGTSKTVVVYVKVGAKTTNSGGGYSWVQSTAEVSNLKVVGSTGTSSTLATGNVTCIAFGK